MNMDVDAFGTFRCDHADRNFVSALALNLDCPRARGLLGRRKWAPARGRGGAKGRRADVPPVWTSRHRFTKGFIRRKSFRGDCLGLEHRRVEKTALCRACFAHSYRLQVLSLSSRSISLGEFGSTTVPASVGLASGAISDAPASCG